MGDFMRTLLPTELWEYRLRDIARGLWAATVYEKKKEFVQVPGIGSCVPVRSGRAGLLTAIKALGLSPGARIGVPLYCCPIVFKVIKMAGCIPCFVDVEASTFCMSSSDLLAKISRIDAVIAVHMFGNLCDLSALQRVANGRPIIEDCAQSLGSKINNQTAGSFGAVAVFSFRSGKYLSAGEGGALFSRHSEIQSQLSQLVSFMPAPEHKDEYMHVAATYVRTLLRRRPLYGLAGYPLWYIYNKHTEYSEKSPVILSKIYKSDLAITNSRFALLDTAIARQRSIAEFYGEALGLSSEMLCAERPNTFYNRYLYPITFPSLKHRDSMTAYLRRRRIGVIEPYKDIPEIATKYYGYTGDCPVAEDVSNRILAIPNNHSLKQKDIHYIASYVNKGWAEMMSL